MIETWKCRECEETVIAVHDPAHAGKGHAWGGGADLLAALQAARHEFAHPTYNYPGDAHGDLVAALDALLGPLP